MLLLEIMLELSAYELRCGRDEYMLGSSVPSEERVVRRGDIFPKNRLIVVLFSFWSSCRAILPNIWRSELLVEERLRLGIEE